MVLSFRSIDYGSDVGLVTFVGEWLHFEGVACSFSLKSTELASQSSVCFEGPEGLSKVKFRCESDRKQFSKEFLAWSWRRSTEGESPLPPVTPQAGIQLNAWQSISNIPIQAAMVVLISKLVGLPLGFALVAPFFAGTLFGLAKTYVIRRKLTSFGVVHDRESQNPHLTSPCLDQNLSASPSRVPGGENIVDQQNPPPPNEISIGHEGPN